MKQKIISIIILLSIGLFAQETDYVLGEMLVQFQNELRGSINIIEQDGIALTGIPAIDALNRHWQVSKMKKVILDPNPDEIAKRMGLDMLYHLTFPKETNIEQILAAYKNSPYVRYTCPNAIYRIQRIPNDPRYPEQWHLPNIGCPDAWEVSTGDSSVVTAIVDMGVDYTHEDIQDNLWINHAEDINHNGRFDPSPPPTGDLNNIDEDSNGYYDDVIGYDFVYGDPDPTPTTPGDDHGQHCFGIASAVTNNNTGVASVGWNVRGMALKCGEGSGIYLYSAIAAIYYAADKGAWVISMSYGGYRQQFEPESIALAYAWERGLVECAGAGNDNRQSIFYPAAYSWVIAVAASNPSNLKADFSNYGTWIDVCAPGTNILSTTTQNGYVRYDGTSMACPVVAGVAALVKSAFPTMTNAECTTRIFESCDSMSDPLYRSGLLGYGRVNVAKAILQVIRCNLNITSYRINDQSGNNNGIPDPGETVALIITLANEPGWQDANDVTAVLTNDDPEIEVTKGTASFPSIPAGGSGNCSADSFVFRVSVGSPPYRSRFNININATPQTLHQYEQIRLKIGSPRVLLVDDDEGSNLENWYGGACDSLGVLYNLWTNSVNGSPVLDTLNNYPVVIWFTGLDSTQTLSSTDMANLSSYLDNGGNLFLCGQNLGQDIGTQPFYANYLHARYLNNRISTGPIPRVIGINGDPIGESDTDTLVLMGTGGAGNARSMDGIQPLSVALGSHRYPNNPDTIYAGIHYSGDYKVVYFSFPFEAVDANPTRYTQKWEILRRILLFFDEQLPGFEEPYLEFSNHFAIQPNPFSSHTIIGFSPLAAVKNQKTDFKIYDLSGKMVRHWRLSQQKSTVLWDGTDSKGNSVPNGIYFGLVQNISLPASTFVTKLVKLK
ncbi:MAG: S8 family serine peptidase [candidate division WOR-3 bacterium]|nr:S8 family serine peptidase [candidate division WOR-3 bacterium]MDH5683011.1 S8 family serine peptidase [candidate division WOR-3 bacterium]